MNGGHLTVITGATASGKSALSLALAKRIGGEIISADSMQIYRRLNIGTAKPSAEERRAVRHHLIDIIEPNEDFSVGLYEKAAVAAIEDARSRGKTPVVCGGTGLYINALLFPHAFGGAARDSEYRGELLDFVKKEGADALYSRLVAADPETAAKLHPNDTRRVIRALEILRLTGRKKSEAADAYAAPPRYPYKLYVLELPRAELYARINRRADAMFELGLTEEVRALKREGLTAENTAMKAIGYKEIFRYLDGELTPDAAAELVRKNTRNYAKRQITYFKSMKNPIYLDGRKKTEELCETILS